MTAVWVALIVPWAAGAALVLFDGRRVVGWLAVVALVANVAALAVLAADVLSGGPVEATTGDWPPGVGIMLRARTRWAWSSQRCRRWRCSPPPSSRCSTACASACSPAWRCC